MKIERKKNEEIKGRLCSSSLIPVYRIHLPTVHLCTEFQPTRPDGACEKCDKTLRQKNKEIKGRISSSSLIPVHRIRLPTIHMCTKFQPTRPHSSWEKIDENLQCLKIGEKAKWRNKGTNKQQKPDYGIHDTSTHCPYVYQVSTF